MVDVGAIARVTLQIKAANWLALDTGVAGVGLAARITSQDCHKSDTANWLPWDTGVVVVGAAARVTPHNLGALAHSGHGSGRCGAGARMTPLD